LGQARYADLAVLLSFVSIFNLLGNAMTDACVKFICKSATARHWEEANEFLINAIVVAFWVTLSGCLCAMAAGWLNPLLIGRLPVLFVCAMLSGVFLTLLSGIYSTGNFYNENFVSSAMVISIGKIIYAAGAWFGIVRLDMNFWGVAVGSTAGALFGTVGAYLLFKKNLPNITLSWKNLSFEKQGRIVSFVGWMLFVYCGTYCASSAILLIANRYAAHEEIARLALALQVGAIAAQILTCFSYMTSPGIYKALSKDNERLASRYLRLLLDLALPASICGMLIVYFVGDQIFYIWLGDHAPPRMVPAVLGSFLSFSLVSINIPFCAYFAAADRIRIYGLCCLVESALICLTSYILFNTVPPSVDRIMIIVFVPGIFISIKLLILSVIRYGDLSISFYAICKTILTSSIIAVGASFCFKLFSSQNFLANIMIFVIPFSIFLRQQLRHGPTSHS